MLLYVLNLFAKLLDCCLELQADIRELDIIGFGAERVGFSVELLREKIESAADRTALPDQPSRLRHMGRQAIKLLTHVGPGRDHDRFLVQPVGIETLGLREQRGNLLGKPGANGLGPAARSLLGAFDKHRDFVEAGR
jgi:hypothetical protein